MKIPKKPPEIDQLLTEVQADRDRLLKIVQLSSNSILPAGKYLHWDKLRFYDPPQGLTHKEWWFVIKLSRKSIYNSIPLLDKEDRPFKYLQTTPIIEMLHFIDKGAAGNIMIPDSILFNGSKDHYIVNSLIEEAITSSQLEGAATTRKIAKEMIKSNRRPHDRSEQMIFNNFITMQEIIKIKDQPLSKELVLHIHRLVTQDTLDNPDAAGRFRKQGENCIIGDDYGQVFHEPPDADQLADRMTAMSDFANDDNSNGFIHPVIRSIMLHFWLAYDHPFVDGNGRTARALFYWSMLRGGYWLFEFISISQIILKAPARYGRAYLYTETDDNDLTYFILYHLDIISRAIDELQKYITGKTKRLQQLESQIQGIQILNFRQIMLINHALKHPRHKYTFKSHQISNKVAYQTARTDLIDLHEKGLLTMKKIGKTWYFQPAENLEKKLESLA